MKINVFLLVITLSIIVMLIGCGSDNKTPGPAQTPTLTSVPTPSSTESSEIIPEEPLASTSSLPTRPPPPRPPRPPIEPPPPSPSTPVEEQPSVHIPTVAFMKYTNDSWDEYIYMIEADCTGLRKLTPDQNVREDFPQFSPDGQKIAFSRWPKDGNPDIWVMNSDGADRVALTNLDWADMPAWSPDGKHIAFVSKQDNQLEISVMD
jgi:WD40 repeat protein